MYEGASVMLLKRNGKVKIYSVQQSVNDFFYNSSHNYCLNQIYFGQYSDSITRKKYSSTMLTEAIMIINQTRFGIS